MGAGGGKECVIICELKSLALFAGENSGKKTTPPPGDKSNRKKRAGGKPLEKKRPCEGMVVMEHPENNAIPQQDGERKKAIKKKKVQDAVRGITSKSPGREKSEKTPHYVPKKRTAPGWKVDMTKRTAGATARKRSCPC